MTDAPSASAPAEPSAAIPPRSFSRERLVIVLFWLALSAILLGLARQNLSAPGLYYDEAIFGGLARDFVTGQPHGSHLPDSQVVDLFGRPFPLCLAKYLGAVRSWLLIPAFAVWGSSLAVLRLATLGWSLVALLFFLLWTWRWLGVAPALISGAILAFDPTFFFLSIVDWGAVGPSMLCRFAGFYLALLWWRNGRVWHPVLAAFLLGLGLFNKLDFAVILAGVGAAFVVCYGRSLWVRLRNYPSAAGWAWMAFLLPAAPTLLQVPYVWNVTLPFVRHLAPRHGLPGAAGELTEKVSMLTTMFDGSYFYRLMDVGGQFERMYEKPAPVWMPLGIAFALSIVFLIAEIIRLRRTRRGGARPIAFLLLATGLLTLGLFLLPVAVRIHHAVLLYPFPQLTIALALTLAWQRFGAPGYGSRVIRGLLAAATAVLLATQAIAIGKTEALIRRTGGRGLWCNRFDAFCQEIKDRSDLTIVSLDWGFNEQLLFLTRGPALEETFWETRKTGSPTLLLPATNYIYLVHPPGEGVLFNSSNCLRVVEQTGTNAEIRPYGDLQNRVAFYTIRFRSPVDSLAPGAGPSASVGFPPKP